MSARSQLFTPVLGGGRGGGRKAKTPDTLPATGLARFSFHPQIDLHLRSEDNDVTVVATVYEYAQRMLAEANLLAAAVAAGWKPRVVKRGNDQWVHVSKFFANAEEAGAELQGLGADDIRLSFFPSGDATDRQGYEDLEVSAEHIHFFKRSSKKNV